MLAVPVQGATLLVLGDSISAAYGMERHQGWVTLLSQRLDGRPPVAEGTRVSSGKASSVEEKWTLVNASISGETTRGGLTRLPGLLERHQPEVVIIELGGNDALRGTPLPVIEKNLKRLVRTSQEAGARVLLAGMRVPPNYGPRYAEGFFALYEQVAASFDVALVPFLLEGVGGQPDMMQADGIHPRARAQPRLLKNLWPYLQPLLVDV